MNEAQKKTKADLFLAILQKRKPRLCVVSDAIDPWVRGGRVADPVERSAIVK